VKALCSYFQPTPDAFVDEVHLLSYDRNKYCEVRLSDGTVEGIKTGYLCRPDGRRFNLRQWVQLPRRMEDPMPTRLQQAEELRREKKTSVKWVVHNYLPNSTDTSFFKTKKQALKAFVRKLRHPSGFGVVLNLETQSYGHWSNKYLASREIGEGDSIECSDDTLFHRISKMYSN
jgi:hypothetical protein